MLFFPRSVWFVKKTFLTKKNIKIIYDPTYPLHKAMAGKILVLLPNHVELRINRRQIVSLVRPEKGLG